MDDDDRIRHARRQFVEAKDEFRQAHKAGMEALERGDYVALTKAIVAECDAIEKQKSATEQLWKERFAALTKWR